MRDSRQSDSLRLSRESAHCLLQRGDHGDPERRACISLAKFSFAGEPAPTLPEVDRLSINNHTGLNNHDNGLHIFKLSDVSLTRTPGGKHYYYSHFTDEDTESQRSRKWLRSGRRTKTEHRSAWSQNPHL